MNLESLKWQVAMGADEAVADAPAMPQNTAAQPSPAVTPAQAEPPAAAPNDPTANTKTAPPAPPKTNTPKPPSELESTARSLADAATTLAELRTAIESFDGLAIKKTAKNTVFSDGTPQADIMFIGEAPGANEDETGIPFCGASGQLMDKAVIHIGLERSKNLYITNTIFWRPPGNRTPTKQEIAICRPFVEKHIALINPKLLVLVGGTAANSLLNDNKGISKLRGDFTDYNNPYLEKPTKVTAIFHPSFLLRSPGKKKDFWFDLLKIKDFTKNNNIPL